MFYVFGFCYYYPDGGAKDLQVVKSSLKDAKKYIDDRILDVISLDEYHVMDKKGIVIYTKRRAD